MLTSGFWQGILIMKLTEEDLTELQAIWKEVLDEDITPSFAKDRGNARFELYLLMEKLTANVPPKVFVDKQPILQAGVDALLKNDQGGYIAAIKILLTEVEGIVRNHYAAVSGKADRVKIPELAKHAATQGLKSSGSEESLLLPVAFSDYLTKHVFVNFNLATGELAPSRNTVGHGVAKREDYTRARAIQALLILDQLWFLLS